MNMTSRTMTFSPRTWIGPRTSTCAICGGTLADGDVIVDVRDWREALRGAGVSKTKVFKYAHAGCIPALPTEKERSVLREACGALAQLPPPQNQKDGKGLSGSSNSPVRQWIAQDCPAIAAQKIARIMVQHVETQIGGRDSEMGRTILALAKRKGPYTAKLVGGTGTNPNGTGTNNPRGQAEIHGTTIVLINSAPRTNYGEDLIVDYQDKYLFLFDFNARRPSREQLDRKNQVKATGARFEGAPYWRWYTTDVRVLQDNFSCFSDAVWTKAAVDQYLADTAQVETVEAEYEMTDLLDVAIRVGENRTPGQVLVDMNGEGLKVVFDYPKTTAEWQFKDTIKGMGGRFDPKTKHWRVGVSTVIENFMVFDKCVFTPKAVAAIRASLDRRALANAVQPRGLDLDIFPDGLKLYPFQAVGVEFIAAANGRALLADDMGLGKTITSIAYLVYAKIERAIIVVPAIVTTNWAREVRRWYPAAKTVRVKSSADLERLDGSENVIILSTGLFSRSGGKAAATLKRLKPTGIILDECHQIKNPKAQRTKVLLDLCAADSLQAVIGLSGTPITNRPIEFYNILNLLRPEDFNSWYKYAVRYCDGHRNRFGFDASGSSNISELQQKLKDLMLRRTKTQVLPDLPAKIREKTMVVSTPREKRLLAEMITHLKKDKKPGAALTALNCMRQAIGKIKADRAIAWFEYYRDLETPLIVFAHHKDVLDRLENICQEKGFRYGRIDGAVSQEKRGSLVNSFQNGELDIIIISIQAGGVGITLTKSNHVLFVERAWTPADEEQAEDRSYRIGQDRGVLCRYLVLDNYIDQKIDELIEAKRKVFQAVVDGGATENGDIRSELVDAWENDQF